MTLLYVAGLVGGGIFVLLAALGGLDGTDIAGDDWDAQGLLDFAQGGTDGGAGAGAGEEGGGSPGLTDGDLDAQRPKGRPKRSRFPWLPFLRWRFWTFGLCFFGVMGLLLGWLQPSLPPLVALLWAVGTGTAIGTAATWILAWLQLQGDSDSLLRPEDWIGAAGVVELPFDASSRGKVRLVVRGSPVAVQAITREERPFRPGDRVFVIALEGGRAWVASDPGDRDRTP
ncbi:MAG: hypothetical protein Fur0042_05620 [Cyanophyceae cyanobacterium]